MWHKYTAYRDEPEAYGSAPAVEWTARHPSPKACGGDTPSYLL